MQTVVASRERARGRARAGWNGTTGQSRLDDIDARIRASGTQTVVQLVTGEVVAQLSLIANALYQRVTIEGDREGSGHSTLNARPVVGSDGHSVWQRPGERARRWAELSSLAKAETAKAANALSLLMFMRYVRRWVISEVVTPKQPAERALVINQFIKILNLCFEIRNFEVAMAILEALK